MNVMLGSKNVENISDVSYTKRVFNVMLENNVCNVSYIVLSFHVYNNQILHYTVLSLHACNIPIYGRNSL